MNMKTKYSRYALAITAIVVSSCTFGPNYQREELPMPAAFRGGYSSDNSIAALPWGKVFETKDRQRLRPDTCAVHRDVRAMMANVERARQYVVVAQAPLFPWFGYGAGVSKGSNYTGGNISSTGGTTNTPGYVQGAASWELDIWGKTRRSTEAAVSEYLASEEGQRALMLSLMRQVATGYFTLLELDDELRIMREAVVQYEKALDIFEAQLQGKIGSKLPVMSAQAALAATRTQILSIENEIASLENTLSVLAGNMPGKIRRSGSLAQLANSVSVPAGLPAQILNRRPDIRQQEQLLRASNARIGVAIANYFPSISLTGAGGLVTADLEKVKGRTSGWGLGVNLTGPLFQGGSLRASEKIARQDFLSAKNNYEQSVLSALSEVSTTLINRSKFNAMCRQQEEAVAAYKVASETSLELFTAGVNPSYLDVLYAMQNQFPAEVKLSQYNLQYANTLVNLYTALGGGWNMSNKQFTQGPRN